MAQLERTLTVSAPLARVADYLSDLTTSPDWDPHTRSCRRLDDGPLRVGARYEQVREFAGRQVTVGVELVEFAAHERIVWRSTHRFATGSEHFAFDVDAGGRLTVTHGVEVSLRGLARRLGDAMVPGVMRRIADDGTGTLQQRLQRLA